MIPAQNLSERMITQQTLYLAAGRLVSVVSIECGGSGWLQRLKNEWEGDTVSAVQRTFSLSMKAKESSEIERDKGSENSFRKRNGELDLYSEKRKI